MDVIRIHATLNSDLLDLPELRPFLGKPVEITVKEEAVPLTSNLGDSLERVSPLAGSILRDDDPLGPAAPSEPAAPPEVPYSEWKAHFDAWMAEVKARAKRYPPGFVMDDSRESMYEGRGE